MSFAPLVSNPHTHFWVSRWESAPPNRSLLSARTPSKKKTTVENNNSCIQVRQLPVECILSTVTTKSLYLWEQNHVQLLTRRLRLIFWIKNMVLMSPFWDKLDLHMFRVRVNSIHHTSSWWFSSCSASSATTDFLWNSCLCGIPSLKNVDVWIGKCQKCKKMSPEPRLTSVWLGEIWILSELCL